MRKEITRQADLGDMAEIAVGLSALVGCNFIISLPGIFIYCVNPSVLNKLLLWCKLYVKKKSRGTLNALTIASKEAKLGRDCFFSQWHTCCLLALFPILTAKASWDNPFAFLISLILSGLNFHICKKFTTVENHCQEKNTPVIFLYD